MSLPDNLKLSILRRVNLEVENGEHSSLYIDNSEAATGPPSYGASVTIPVQPNENESLMTANLSQPESLPLSEVGHFYLQPVS